MSEPLLKANLRLFAAVATEGEVTQQERDQIKIFLQEHVSKAAVQGYLQLFEEYAKKISVASHDAQSIKQLCEEINPQLTQKQKIVIILELISIIQADGSISEHEEILMKTIGGSFKVSEKEIDAIKIFVLGNESSNLNHDHILIIDASP